MPKIYGKRNVGEKPIQSYWPEWTSRLFESLKEIPWLSLTAVSTLLGALILFSYFRSIDHFPSDFSSLVGLGAATALCAFALVVVLAIGLFAPAAVYQHYSVDERASSSKEKKLFTEYELLFLQLGGLGWVLSGIAYSEYENCLIFISWYTFAGVPLLMLGLISFFKIVLHHGNWRRRLFRGWMAICIAVLSLAPFLVLLPFKDLIPDSSMDSSVVFLTLWALAVLANAATATQLPAMAVALIAVLLAGFMYLAFPLVTDRPSFFPTMVASFIGVRDEKVQDLRVPRKTCELIKSALGESDKSKDFNCTTAEWGEVRARMLSNVGDRWLIEIDIESAANSAKASGLRLTIPKNDIQIVRRQQVDANIGKKASCVKS